MLLSPTLAYPAANVVDYTFDAAGNITEIKRQVLSGFAITSFDPGSGAIGTTVTVYGAGFSSTPASNTLKFNGTTATVTASDSGSISTAVPSGANTGRITVTVGGSTATSAQDFVVTIAGAPTISGFAPSSGAAGTTVALAGTDFGTTAGSMTVKLNGETATATLDTATALTFVVPGAAASGRITATNAIGTGQSTQDFVVPPAGVNAGDITAVARATADGSALNVAVGTAGKHALVLFDGTADKHYTLQASQLAFSPSSALVPYKIIKPDNTTLMTGNLGSGYRPTIHLPKLTATGTYSLLISPGTATLNANIRLVGDPVLPVDGAAVNASTDWPSQTMRFVVGADAGQRIGMGVSGYTHSPANAAAAGFPAYKPDGTQLGGINIANCSPATSANLNGDCDGELVATVAGLYTVLAQPAVGATAAFSVQMSAFVSGTLTADNGVGVTLARVGQDARYTFTGTAGDSFGVALSGVAQQPQVQTIWMYAWKPDGTSLASNGVVPPAAGYVELGALAVSGEHAVTLDPGYGAYGSMRLTLKQGAMVGTSDAPAAFTTATASEAARFRFSATAGQSLAAGLSGVTGNATLYVYGPNRAQIGNFASCFPATAGGRCKVTIASIPTTGTYSIVILPAAGVQIGGNASLSADILGTLSAGVAQTITATREAQNARLTFPGTGGDSTSLKLWAVSTTPASQNVNILVYRPDGGFLTSATVSNGSVVVPLNALPTTGNYTAVVEPQYGTPWQGTVMLDAGTTLSIGGTTASLASANGEPLRYRFSGTAGQRFELGIGGLGYASATTAAAALTVFTPSGSSLLIASCLVSNGGCETWSASLPATGTYAISLVPPSTPDLTAGTLALSTPVAGTFVVGDPAQAVTISRPGQTVRYTFSGTSAQLLRLSWSGPSVTNASAVGISIIKPDGSTLSSGSLFNATAGGVDIASLPVSGTYTVVIDPAWAATMSASISLATR